MQRIEGVAGFAIEDDQVFLAPAGLRISNPVLRLLCLGGEDQPSRVSSAQQAVAKLLAAGGAFTGTGVAEDLDALERVADSPRLGVVPFD